LAGIETAEVALKDLHAAKTKITEKYLVLVKGSDYKIEDIVGSDWVISHGGEVKTIDFLPGYSTSSIERKILQAHNVHE
jgi:bifunctional ADP-heptose synthase (sugar kinase/adenylyltransferase)